jgi:hypothetical protein
VTTSRLSSPAFCYELYGTTTKKHIFMGREGGRQNEIAFPKKSILLLITITRCNTTWSVSFWATNGEEHCNLGESNSSELSASILPEIHEIKCIRVKIRVDRFQWQKHIWLFSSVFVKWKGSLCRMESQSVQCVSADPESGIMEGLANHITIYVRFGFSRNWPNSLHV